MRVSQSEIRSRRASTGLAPATVLALWMGFGSVGLYASLQQAAKPLSSQADARSDGPSAQDAVTSEQQAPEKRGDLYMARKYYKEAAEAYEKAIAEDPKNAQLHNKLGIAHHQLLEFPAARKSYQKAIQLKPDYAQAINNLAAVEYSQKRYKASILDYLKALKLTPGDAVIYSNLGTSYFALERFDYATQAYRYALQIDPQIFQHQGRTGVIVQQRDEKNAAAFNFYLAKTYADLNDVENTLLYLRKAWEEGYKDFLKSAKDKTFDFLANEPRFTDLLTEAETAEEKKNQQEQRQ
jgi:tetratricopeptide (TPR) repeat protein